MAKESILILRKRIDLPELSLHIGAHGSFYNKCTNPILIERQPLFTERRVQLRKEFR